MNKFNWERLIEISRDLKILRAEFEIIKNSDLTTVVICNSKLPPENVLYFDSSYRPELMGLVREFVIMQMELMIENLLIELYYGLESGKIASAGERPAE
jgi:hypothetical protein